MSFDETSERPTINLLEVAGQPKALEEAFILNTYNSYSPALFYYVLCIVPDKVKAGEILASAFVKACKNLSANIHSTLFVWLLNAVRNEAIETLIDMNISGLNVELSEADMKTDPENFRLYITELPLIEKTIFSLVYYRNYSPQEVADFLKLPVHLVRNKLLSAKQKLPASFALYRTAVEHE